ncbi:MAG: gluconate 2-dehydrogenase subunit 3 family protein [Litorilituus sp.]|jgi:gluconate 2-dehydrogenase gamma chain|nr:gluconate 2-dehydrogenase subunit 3 family protein [Litorilituus sp.]
MKSFFSQQYQTPAWFKEKQLKSKISRRALLKSAAGASAMTAVPVAAYTLKKSISIEELSKTDPWLTLDATLLHLLPESNVGPSAKDINATTYLYQVITVQPTHQDEKDFIIKGVGWLNGFSQSKLTKPFVQLPTNEKEFVLQSISNSRAGSNWLTTLLSYIFEAMLAPPAYGGNPHGIGWQWLDHKAGFPLPQEGQRFFELPPRALAKNETVVQKLHSYQTMPPIKSIIKA